MSIDLREIQKPLKAQYRKDPRAASITLRASGVQGGTPLACSADLGRTLYGAQAHKGVGGSGAGVCSGGLLLGALATCAQITCQMVAEALQIPTRTIKVTVEGDLDLRGTLGIAPGVPGGFQDIRLSFQIDAPEATPNAIKMLQEKMERCCVVLQTIAHPPAIEWRWSFS